ncbi:MAG: hypothetical protein KY468_04350 [Armatimonadetes bacterium]|nr:hypothetical protein [Armatimonadota bacterium]
MDTSEEIGVLTHFITEPVDNRIIGFGISTGEWYTERKAILFPDVSAFGVDAVIVKAANAVRPITQVSELQAYLNEDREKRVRQAISASGQSLGTLTDWAFDEKNADVVQFRLERPEGGEAVWVPRNAFVRSGKAVVILDSTMLSPNGSPPSGGSETPGAGGQGGSDSQGAGGGSYTGGGAGVESAGAATFGGGTATYTPPPAPSTPLTGSATDTTDAAPDNSGAATADYSAPAPAGYSGGAGGAAGLGTPLTSGSAAVAEPTTEEEAPTYAPPTGEAPAYTPAPAAEERIEPATAAATAAQESPVAEEAEEMEEEAPALTGSPLVSGMPDTGATEEEDLEEAAPEGLATTLDTMATTLDTMATTLHTIATPEMDAEEEDVLAQPVGAASPAPYEEATQDTSPYTPDTSTSILAPEEDEAEDETDTLLSRESDVAPSTVGLSALEVTEEMESLEATEEELPEETPAAPVGSNGRAATTAPVTEQPVAEQLKEAINRNKEGIIPFVVGKYADRDILDDDGRQIVAQGQQITLEIASLASRA